MTWYREVDDDGREAGERRFNARQILSLLLPYFAKQGHVLSRGVGLLLIMTAADLAGPQILRRVVNDAIAGRSEGHVLGLAAMFVGIVAVSLTMNWLITMLVTRAGLSVVTDLKQQLFRHVLSLNLGFFQTVSPGKLLARVESDTENLKQLFSQAAIRMTHSLLLFLGIFGVMLAEDWRITAVVFACMLFLGLLSAVFLGLVKNQWRESRRRFAEISAKVAEDLGAVEVIQHYSYQGVAQGQLSALGAKKLRADANANVLEHGFWGVFHAFETLTMASIVAVGSGRILSGTMDAGTLVMFLEYLRQAFLPILAFSEFFNFVQRSFISAERVFGILAIERDDGRPPAAAAEDEGRTGVDIPFEDAIRFEGVTFEYEPGHPVLHDVSFEVRKGQTVAVVGPSGGGKSTLVNLLLRFYEPRSGRITVDGADLRGFARRDWRRKLGLVLQGVHLFPGSLRDNLSVFDPSRDVASVDRALETVQARPLVSRLSGGLDAELAERGANLSVGERQLVSFARALVHDPPILVLDEATSSVDPATERRIQQGLERMLAGRTALIIAHRLSTIVRADRILVVLDGAIVESGTHDELYRRGGHYRTLFDLQFHNGASSGTLTGAYADGSGAPDASEGAA